MAKLVAGTNNNGYFTALDRGFENTLPPTPSAFSQFRKTISSSFFEDQFRKEISSWESDERPRWKGLYINAIDGDQLTLPASQDIFDGGYKGVPCPDKQETYYPAMYYACATDLITGVPIGFSASSKNDEISRAIEIVSKFQIAEKCLTVFDRLYFCGRLLDLYSDSGFFIARAKTGSTFTEIVEFSKTEEKEKVVFISGVKCRLIRFTPEGSDKEILLTTNLPKSFKNKEVEELYGYRWECEISNRDRTTSLRMEQFRSKTLNGVFQEIWMLLLLQAATQIACAKEIKPEQTFMKPKYERSNFKVVFNKIVDAIGDIMLGIKDIFDHTKRIILATKQTRVRYSRFYERVTKTSLGKQFPRKSLVKRRE